MKMKQLISESVEVLRGWGVLDESKTSESRKQLKEYEEDWKNRKVKNPKTGREVMVGSLEPKEQEKYKPKQAGEPKYDARPGEGGKGAGKVTAKAKGKYDHDLSSEGKASLRPKKFLRKGERNKPQDVIAYHLTYKIPVDAIRDEVMYRRRGKDLVVVPKRDSSVGHMAGFVLKDKNLDKYGITTDEVEDFLKTAGASEFKSAKKG